jgi:hypothetical protein
MRKTNSITFLVTILLLTALYQCLDWSRFCCLLLSINVWTWVIGKSVQEQSCLFGLWAGFRSLTDSPRVRIALGQEDLKSFCLHMSILFINEMQSCR